MIAPVIVDAVRTPVGRGKVGGALAAIHPTDLLAVTFQAIVERNAIDPGTVDDVIVGCVSQVGEQSASVSRVASVRGLPSACPLDDCRSAVRFEPAGHPLCSARNCVRGLRHRHRCGR
jgi:acetyl-CoA acetyltransferase